MKIALVYIHVPHDPEHVDLACRFVATYHEHPPLIDHQTVVVCNGSAPSTFTRVLFGSLPNLTFYNHSDVGFDIGAYLAFAAQTDADMLFCCGGPCYFRRGVWLKRIADVWQHYGPGMYGTLATYEVRPHFCTSGFAVPPRLLREYPFPVRDKAERYNFEHGQSSLVGQCMSKGLPTILVTWDGAWNWQHWRVPKNIYCRGDQSNCLTYFRHSDSYEQGNYAERRRRELLADTLTHENSARLFAHRR